MNGTQPYQMGFTYNGVPGAPDPVEVVNVSFGDRALTDDDADADDIYTAFFGVSQALGAGNLNVDGTPTVDNIGRNTMSVAALNDVGTITSTDDVVTGFSARGPSPGGRKKPDLIAPGGAVVAADSHWNTPPSNPDYTPMSGTSFSSPHVAGAMTLLEGAGITDPMAQRAILINSARDWNGTNTGLHGWTAPQTGWRPEVGWGILDLTQALAQRADYRLGSVSEGEAAFYRATVPAGSKATLAFQLRGFFVGYPNPGTQTLKYTQSNLDLHQYDSSDTEVTPPAAFDPPDTTIDPGPDAIDPNDTVEQVRSPGSPGSQQVTYKVQSASTIDGAATEPFAIAAAAPLTPLASPTVKPTGLSADLPTVRCNQPVSITTATQNISPDLGATNASVTIDLPPGVSLVSGAATQVVSGGSLATGATSETHTWSVQAASEGPKSIGIDGAGDAYGTTFRDSDEVQFTADCTPPDTAITSGPGGPTNDRAPLFAFSGQGGAASFECSVDASSYVACGSPFTTPQLSEGGHEFAVRSVDGVGNVDPAPAVRSFTVDTTPPDTTIVSGPPDATRSASVAFQLSGGSSYECSLDDAPFARCSPTAAFDQIGEGRHDFAARAIDDATNADPTPALASFRVDRSVSRPRLKTARTVQFEQALHLKAAASLGEGGTVRISASGKAAGHKFKSRARSADLSGEGKANLRITAGPAGNRALRGAVESGLVKLKVRAKFSDELGNTRTLKRVVTLR